MASEPRALEPGWRFADRFENRSVLGRGGFGIAYLALDLVRGDLVVVKELAPQGTPRSQDGVIRFDDRVGSRLRGQFLEEAGILSRFDIKGVPPIRATFRENGTAYFVTNYVPDSRTLQDVLRQDGTLPPTAALDIFFALLDILEVVHAKRILHRDIKPSNVLLDRAGNVYLIDFGAAREWHADTTVTHTVLHTPGFAPPEQLSERARRGPATDLYALCATFFVMVTGVPPPSATDRAAGIALPSLLSYRPNLEPVVVRTIEAGLSLAYADRPQTVADLKEMLAGELDRPVANSLAAMDETLLRLKRFSFEKKACPGCKGLLVEPKPLKRYVCPVCRVGTIRRRDIHDRLCPSCQSGVLTLVKNLGPLGICPTCQRGTLNYKRKSLISLDQVATCAECSARFDVRAGQMAPADGSAEFASYDYWRDRSGRSTEVWKCPDCPAQFDVLPDGRWSRFMPASSGSHQVLYPDEWARVAIGLAPGAGNAECDACGADFFSEKERLTLVDAKEDPHGFAEAYLGRLLSVEDVRWLGGGKTSPHSGLVCETCHTELDRDQQYVRLVATTNRRLARFMDQPKVMEDWHRIAQDLPTIHEEADFIASFGEAITEAYRLGKVGFDTDNTILWRGEATRTEDEKTSTLQVTHAEIVFGGLLWKRRMPTDALVGVWADEEELHLQFSGERGAVGYRLAPMELVAHLASGDRKVGIDARDLAARLTTELGL